MLDTGHRLEVVERPAVAKTDELLSKATALESLVGYFRKFEVDVPNMTGTVESTCGGVVSDVLPGLNTTSTQ